MNVRLVGGVALGLVLLCASGFLVAPSNEAVEPVSFEDTLSMGMTGVDVAAATDRGYALPRAQVFYGQYQYVVGYYGVETLVTHLASGSARRQFGDPLAVFVTDFSGTEPFVTGDGFLDLGNDLARDWVRASDAWYVVDSRARTPAGPTVVPFSSRGDADAFAEAHGGSVVDWTGLRDAVGDAERDTPGAFRAAVANQSRWADGRVAAARDLRSRPVSVVVGEDEPTVATAIAAAPPNTTVAIPPGRYDVNLTVEKPLTLRGAGAETVLDGGGNGTVLTVEHDRVAVTSLALTGTGTVDAMSPTAGNASRYADTTMLVYGRSDAAVTLVGANESLVADVRVETEATGVMLQYSDGTVVRNVTVRGADDPRDGSMGVITLYSRAVVEDNRVRGGRDGVYLHRSDGAVVRDNDLADMRYGIHEMYTSDLLLRNNTLERANTGIILMTRPANNKLVGNRATDNGQGIYAIGGSSYIAENVVAGNDLGLTVGTRRSVVVHNTVVDNAVGVRVGTLLPTNHVVANDVVGNDQPVTARSGPVHVWTVAGAGNYWGPVPGIDRDGDGAVDRAFRPADRVDVIASRAAGGPTLARSPVLGLLERVAASVPGLRDVGVVDTAPRVAPARPDRLAEVRNGTDD
ncbi:MAG: NosD domain-containing protein [Haloarculaceae archaeon]